MVMVWLSHEGQTQRKVAIVGGGPTRRDAPFDDPAWEIWGFSSKDWKIPRVTRWFEIHAWEDLEQQLAAPKRGRRTFSDYIRFMSELDAPVYVQRPLPQIPRCVEFPVDRLLAEFGRCFTSTASYLVGLAIVEGVDVIGLWGINPTSRSFAYQLPSLQYLLGHARRRGIEVCLPRSLRLEIPEKPKFVETPVLYAYEWESPLAWWRERLKKKGKRRR